MSKLFISCSSLVFGGAERVLSILSTPFADHYDEVHYIMWQDRPVFYTINERVKIISIEKLARSSDMRKKIFYFRQYINLHRPDVILSLSAPFNMLTIASLLGTKYKIIAAERVDPRSFHWGRHLEIARNCLYRRASRILAQTQYCKEYFTGNLRRKTDVIFNPVIMPKEIIGSALTEKKENLIITAGRLAVQKRHDLLIKVFAKFSKIYTDYKLVIYGEGSERENLTNLIKKLNLTGRVKLPGAIPNLWDKLKSANMFVMTSIFEGMSNSLIEAMCLGLPCISTKVSGAIDLIENNRNGILIDIDDEKALLDSMKKIAQDENYAYKIGKEASKVYDILNADIITKQWLTCIDNIIESN